MSGDRKGQHSIRIDQQWHICFEWPEGLSSAELARSLRVPANRISQLLAAKRAITPDTALRLARYFGTSADLWMNLQKTYELDLARKEAWKEINSIPQCKLARQVLADHAAH